MNGKTIGIFLFGLVVVGVGAYYLGTKTAPVSQSNNVIPVITQQQPVATSTSQVTPTVQVTPQATVDETEALKSVVKQGLIAEHGTSANELTITVSTISGNFAKGMASASAGGGLWFAAKTAGAWKLVWDGNGVIQCESLSQYPDFPASLIPECWDATLNKSVAR
ncbi:MAG TPA: hypothetical protein VMR81_07635 [Patescibacteria group bacterium]|jgi:hypothetical protein|nr:hypothetical protein [Patescibacteria group bacterium]